MMRPSALVFDLDGTLIDSGRDITTAVNLTRADFGLPPLGSEQVGRMVGEGGRMLVRRALGAEVPAESLERALPLYLEHYRAVCLDTTAAYPGIETMLAELASSFPIAVLSNKAEAVSRHILARLGLMGDIREVVGGDTLPTRKPNPGGLFLLADRFDLQAADLLLVGDLSVDADTARAAGCGFALAEWGSLQSGRPPVEAEWRFG
ncbi:MAG: HAD hydrolase-like protein, partial [Acidobacteriota bacterium]|nr:HAD hydrolase-like protein [Acidobacteriota bacterium]